MKIPLFEIMEMKKYGFKELKPYVHNNPLVRWLFWKRLETMLNFTKPVKNVEKVLDFGAGSGIFLPTLSKNFSKVYALDLDTKPLNHIKKKYNFKNLTITKVKGEKLPYKNNFFDIIFAADVLEHFKDSYNLQKEFKRVLKKRGYLIVSGPTENFLYHLARKYLYKYKKPLDHYTNVYEIIKKSSKLFKIEKSKILPCIFIPGFKIYRAKKI